MSTNKHATIRYLALDKCFRNPGKKYFMEDLIQKCNEAIYDFNEIVKGIEKRTIYSDIKFMESKQGWNIDLVRHKDGQKVFYRYLDTSFSINNHLLNESEEQQLKESLLTLSRFKGMPQFEWIDEMVIRLESSFSLKEDSKKFIEFEQNPYLKGLEYFSQIFNSILYKQTLEIKYKGFKQLKSKNLCFHPYYLKQFNNRWFLFGLLDDRDDLTNIAIDRIHGLKDSKKIFKENNLANFEEFFEDIVGVSESTERKTEKVILEIDNLLWPYIQTKPIHGSQKIIKKTNEHVLISLEVQINYELKALLFSMGENLKVIQPERLVHDMKLKAEKLFYNYR